MRADAFVTDARPEVVQALGGRAPTAQQWTAISAPLEPVALIAGAGSGKTAVMAARMVWLIVNGHAKASEILGLTFTNKAAESLLERVRTAIEPLGLPDGEEPTIATYHAFASSLIADYGLRAGIEPGAGLLSEAQAWQLCAEQYLNGEFDELQVRTLFYVMYVRGLADDCANHLVTPDDVIEADTTFLAKIADSGDRIAAKVVSTAKKRIELARVVAGYVAAKDARRAIDYGDQIRLAYEIAKDPQVVADFQARYRFALLDEYQDTNVAQARMLQALMPPGYPVMAVGDPDQNIYAWRGASLRNLLAFARDFPRATGNPAEELRLEVNFRSGARILDLANTLIAAVPEERRPPDKVLRHHEPLGKGSVAVALLADEVDEATMIAREATRLHDVGTPWGEMAVLCRKRRLFDTLVEVMREHEVPIEVIGLGGLLKMPEVIDLVSVLRVLDDPMRNVSLARLLMGPKWRIGYRDLALIASHAAEVNRSLREALPDIDEFPVDVAFSLAEAIEDLNEVEGLSDEANARLRRFNAELAALRQSAHLPLAEIVAAALDTLGLMREIEASPSPGATSAARNLANFMDRVAAFAPLEGEATLGALIEWLDAVEEADEEIEAAQPSEADAVKIMTIHQAKGLEFDVVFLPGLARGGRSQIFPDTGRQANPVENPRYLPFELRGDAEVLPRFTGVLSHFKDELRERAAEEERRLLYVAVTRARQRLVASAAHWYSPTGMNEALKNPMGPSDYWREIRAFPDVEVLAEIEQPEVNPLIDRRAERALDWPRPARRAPDPHHPDGLAATVAAARATTEPDETLFPPEPANGGPSVPPTLSVSSLVTYEACPKKFYWSVVRPLPRRSSAAARIGTAVHAWIERSSKGQIALIDPEEFDERPPGEGDSRVKQLRGVFERSRFAGRTPVDTERAFALVVGGHIIQGRIDAIYDRADGGWEIIDWKTGRAPEEVGALALQLELYGLAAQEIWGKGPEELTLAFVHLGGDEPVELTVAARAGAEIRVDVERALGAIAGASFAPAPSSACTFCDFRADCPEGRAFLAEG